MEYEKTELADYDTVYYFNINDRKRGKWPVDTSSITSDNNFGFDTDSNEYKLVLHEHIAYRFEPIKKLGKGSFGIVVRCFDHKLKT